MCTSLFMSRVQGKLKLVLIVNTELLPLGLFYYEIILFCFVFPLICAVYVVCILS